MIGFDSRAGIRGAIWMSVAGLAVVGAIGALLGSNAAFKLTPNLNQTGKVFTLSFPLNNNYTNAESVHQDMEAACPGAFNKIERIFVSPGGNARNVWLGFGTEHSNFPINAGEGASWPDRQMGFLVQVNSPCTSWTIVGSHDPSFVYSFDQPARVYLTRIPYHTTAMEANDIFLSIPGCNKVERINVSPGGTSRTSWFGFGSVASNFQIRRGEAYIIQVNVPTTWAPPHY